VTSALDDQNGHTCGSASEACGHGVNSTLTAPSRFFWTSRTPAAPRPAEAGGGEVVDPQGVGVGQEWKKVVHPPPDVGLAHAQLDLLA
jgi:hypothetical protein